VGAGRQVELVRFAFGAHPPLEDAPPGPDPDPREQVVAVRSQVVGLPPEAFLLRRVDGQRVRRCREPWGHDQRVVPGDGMTDV
jgi:hypothetical protein